MVEALFMGRVTKEFADLLFAAKDRKEFDKLIEILSEEIGNFGVEEYRDGELNGRSFYGD